MIDTGYVLDGIDTELVRAASLQPVLDCADPPGARRALRRALALSRSLRPAGGAPDDVSVSDRRIQPRRDSPEIPVRVYERKDREVPSPVLVFFHGGAFLAGDLETEDERCREYAARADIFVVSVDYRLAPEHPFPAGFDDCYDSVGWLAANSAELGVDPARIAVGGTSAGGALAAAVSLASRDREGPRIAFQLLLYPVIDNRLASRSMAQCVATPGWNQPNSVHMWRHYLGGDGGDEVSPYAAPARATELTGLPPAYVMTVEHDPLRDEGIAYAVRLMATDVPTELHNLPGCFHGFDAAAPSAELSRRARDEQLTVLAAATGVTVRAPESPNGAVGAGDG